NLLIGGLLLWGFLLNFLTVTLLGDKVVSYAINGGSTVIFIGYLISAILGAVLVHRNNTITTFIGYNLIAVPVGIVLCVALAGYDTATIGIAVLFTAIITAAFMIAASIKPNIFLSMGKTLGVGLIILIVGELVTWLIFRSTAMDYVWAWLGAGLFGLFIGFDWARCNVCACTVNNAVAASANLYLDIINLFLRILQILGKRRD
ncbi:MAG: US12 family protein, partial [Clostridia bacterium]|nr:US12 family protein [Clostridia bacterium]